MPRLTKTLVERAEIKEKPYFLFDDQLSGFCVRVATNGKRFYHVQYTHNKRIKRLPIGQHGILTTEAARDKALTLLANIKNGSDPSADRKRKLDEPIFRDITQRFMKEHARVNCKPKTADGYQRYFDRLILPALGDFKITEIARKDIAELHHQLNERPYDANRCLAILSKLFNLTEVWGLRPDGSNPCRHLKMFKETKRERFLDKDELQRLSQTLIAAEEARLVSPYAIAAFRLLILTGARLSEIQFCKWSYVHLEQAVIRLPDSKTGPRTLHLGQLAIETLRSIPKIEGNPYVICAELVPNQAINDLQKPWRALRKWANIEDVRIHDLRHTFASNAVAMGMSLPMIGKLLGHTQTQTTARYAHLAVSPIIEAADQITGKMGEVFIVPNRLPAPAAIDGEYEVVEDKTDAPIMQKLGNGKEITAMAFLTSDEAAKWLGVKISLLDYWRWKDKGPRFVKIGNRVRYAMPDLQKFAQLA